MDESPSATAPPVGRATSPLPATPLFLGLLFLLLLGIQQLLYRDSFAVKPSSDDFIALHQIERGDSGGVWSFFKASDTGDYRPLQNATYWFFATVCPSRRFLSLRLLHVAGFIFYAAVAFLWIRALGFGRVAAVTAASIVFLHPVLTGPLAGLDNYSRLVVSAWVWLGAWIARVHARRLRVAVPLVSLCFAIALGYMEYALTLAPLAALVVAWRSEKRRLRNASIILACLVAIFCGYYLIRVSGLVATTSGTRLLSQSPFVWAKNGAVMMAAVLFFGNTVPIMRAPSVPGFAWLGSNVALLALALGYGLRAGRRRLTPRAGEDPQTASAPTADASSRPAFLFAALAATFFPMLFMTHISEIYLSAVVVAVALLSGLSAQGWTRAPRPAWAAALILAGFQLLLASEAIQSKVTGINEAGERTEAMMQRVLELVPDDSRTRKVAMVFFEPKTTARRGYSIFALPDDELVQQGYGTFAMRWFRPRSETRLDSLIVSDLSVVNLKAYDLVLVWQESRRQFTVVSRAENVSPPPG